MAEDERSEGHIQSQTSRSPVRVRRWKAGSRLPEGAVLMTSEQVKTVIQKKIADHPRYQDTFLLMSGPLISSSVSAVTTSYLIGGMMKVFSSKVMPISIMMGGTLSAVLPTYILQTLAVHDRIISGSNTRRLQLGVSSVAIQTFFGVVYPCFLSSYKVFTTEIKPYAQEGNLGWFYKTLLKNKSFSRLFSGCLAAQVLLGALVPYLTSEQFDMFASEVFGES
ncbi:uncharacterized protein LOC125658755 [Ostrea edulis]|uniref:uncharacterized protein LOC125658755 n=1 Tax=Ostrea edulis TaxID=37623 RepID=UPI0024AFE455|nr:uncharacterized protein LOC125658755 [Ostrea edulis]